MQMEAPTGENPDWAKVARLRPQLRQHVKTHAQEFRGERWYALLDESSGRNLRFNASAYEFIGRLNGSLTIEQVYEQLQRGSEDETAIDQEEILLILTQLFALDLLGGGVPASAREFFERNQQEKRVARTRAAMNPLSIRISLIDPDRFLNRILPWMRPIFSRTGALVWMILVGLGVVLTITSYPALQQAVDPSILAPSNLLLLLLVFVVTKIIHEFGHAITVKIFGGEVHDMGLTLLVLVPVPYVDASATWGFREKRKRMLVGAIGIMAELFIAALSLIIWLAVEPGLVRDLAMNAFLIASVSTLLFNGNPLLKFDGYYVLQDLIEIPNLSTRASRYWLYLIQRYLFGIKRAHSPVTADGEKRWFIGYGAAAVVYRLFIMVTIVLFLAEQYLVIGVALGCWSVFMQVIMPLMRGLRFLYDSPALAGRRQRAGIITGSVLGVLTLLLLFMPVSLATRAEGVVWVPDQAQLFAGTNGFISEILATPGSIITEGTPVLRMREPLLEARMGVLLAQRKALEVKRAAEFLKFRVKSELLAEEIESVEAELELVREQVDSLLVRSEVGGTLVLPEARALQGSYLRQGQLVGYVISPERYIVRSVVPQADIGLVREAVTNVEVRLAERPREVIPSLVIRETPAGSKALPRAALGAAGGGRIAVKRAEDGSMIAAEKVFQLDLSLPTNLVVAGIGERAYVRFDHGSEPLAFQWLRSLRQLLLSRLSF